MESFLLKLDYKVGVFKGEKLNYSMRYFDSIDIPIAYKEFPKTQWEAEYNCKLEDVFYKQLKIKLLTL